MEHWDTVALCLEPGASVIQDERGWGMKRRDAVRYAATPAQTVILRHVFARVFDLHALTLAIMRETKAAEPQAALSLAAFVLDFSDYLEN